MEDTEESFEGRVLLSIWFDNLDQQILNETYKVAKWKCQYIRLCKQQQSWFRTGDHC